MKKGSKRVCMHGYSETKSMHLAALDVMFLITSAHDAYALIGGRKKNFIGLLILVKEKGLGTRLAASVVPIAILVFAA